MTLMVHRRDEREGRVGHSEIGARESYQGKLQNASMLVLAHLLLHVPGLWCALTSSSMLPSVLQSHSPDAGARTASLASAPRPQSEERRPNMGVRQGDMSLRLRSASLEGEHGRRTSQGCLISPPDGSLTILTWNSRLSTSIVEAATSPPSAREVTAWEVVDGFRSP